MWKKLRIRLQETYGYTRTEAQAVLFLFSIILLALIGPRLLQISTGSSSEIYHDSLDRIMLAELEAQVAKNSNAFSEVTPKKTYPKNLKKQKLFAFDPNTATESELISLGFTSWQADRLVRYRDAGGKFKAPEDLSKLYGLPPSLIDQLKPYVAIVPEVKPSVEYKEKLYIRKPTLVNRIDINTADSAQLEALQGISAYTASRIIKYRDKLGGFVDTLQFAEVWGLDSIWLLKLYTQVFIQADFKSRAMNINSATIEELAAHPYMTKRKASIWIAYRTNKGPAAGETDLLSSKAFSPEDVARLRPYLSFD